MKLLLLLLANAVVLLVLARWLRRQYRLPELRVFLLPALALRLLAGAISTIRPTDDAYYFHAWSGHLAEQLWADPTGWLRMLAENEFRFGGHELIFHGYSNTLFFVKVLSALSWLTGDYLLLKALYLSVASFIGCWCLVRALNRLLPGTRGAAVIGLLLWPSAVYWSCGLTKESLLLTGSSLLLAGALQLLYGPSHGRGWWLLVALLGAWLSFKMRFFFGGVLLGVLLALGLVRTLQLLGGPWARRRWHALSFGLVLLGGLWAASEVSPVFRFNKFASQLTQVHATLRDRSVGRPHVELSELAPTAGSILRNTPKAVFSALFRPFAWEGDSMYYGFAALENLGLLLLTGLALVDLLRGRWAALPFALALALLTYCLLLAALVGLSTPNLGTLSRYRAPWLPLLVYLLVAQPTVSGWLRRLNTLNR